MLECDLKEGNSCSVGRGQELWNGDKMIMNKIDELEDDIILENSEELDQLAYAEEAEQPIFSSVKVTKKDFSIFELYRKYKNGKLNLDVDFQRKSVWENKQKHE